jgi:signal transduction histidine kinase
MGVSGSGVQVVHVADVPGWRSRLSSRTREGLPSVKRIASTWFGITLLYSILLMEQRQIHYGLAFALSAVRFGVLAALFIPLWSCCHRLLEARTTKWRLALAHVGIGVVTLFVWMGVYFPYSAALYGQTLGARMSSIPPLQYLEFVLTYTLMVSGIVAAQLSRRLDLQLRREAQLEALAQEAELRALKAQIRPHFLFNVLNSIYSLIGTRPEQARDMINLVADLMRRTLDASDDEVVSVEWELGVVDSYLRIEKIRLGERLDVSISKQGVSRDAVITPLILQPLVDNAIKHGIGARPGPGSVEVYAIGTDHHLEFVVRDTGPGVVGEVRTLPGHGLNLTRRRLEALYGADFTLTLRNLEPRGFEVRLSLPLRVLSGAPSAASPATPNAVSLDHSVVHV